MVSEPSSETSLNIYHSTLPNVPEELNLHLGFCKKFLCNETATAGLRQRKELMLKKPIPREIFATEKMAVIRLIRKFPAFYRTQKCVALFTNFVQRTLVVNGTHYIKS